MVMSNDSVVSSAEFSEYTDGIINEKQFNSELSTSRLSHQAIDGQFYGNYNINDYKMATQIITILFENRRLLKKEKGKPNNFELEAKQHIRKLIPKINQRSPISLILPAFPAKSPNRKKTLGALPDLAEEYALSNIDKLCKRISSIYEPGTKFTICSDGRVFSDLVRIPDSDVTAYAKHLSLYANEHHPGTFEFMNLDSVFGSIKDFDILREELMINYGESIYSLRSRCKKEKEAKAMYRGIARFIFEDFIGLEPFENQSRASVQKLARNVAYRVIQRSNAWSSLLEEHFSDAIRLSIHPQYKISKKIGIYLADVNDEWLTPWHSVAVKSGGNIYLRKRADAEKNSLLAFKDGRPSHYESLANDA